jgi:hypothetical protein
VDQLAGYVTLPCLQCVQRSLSFVIRRSWLTSPRLHRPGFPRRGDSLPSVLAQVGRSLQQAHRMVQSAS